MSGGKKANTGKMPAFRLIRRWNRLSIVPVRQQDSKKRQSRVLSKRKKRRRKKCSRKDQEAVKKHLAKTVVFREVGLRIGREVSVEVIIRMWYMAEILTRKRFLWKTSPVRWARLSSMDRCSIWKNGKFEMRRQS